MIKVGDRVRALKTGSRSSYFNKGDIITVTQVNTTQVTGYNQEHDLYNTNYCLISDVEEMERDKDMDAKLKRAIEMVTKATEYWANDFYPNVNISKCVSPADKELATIIAKFGCNATAVKELVKNLTGRDVLLPITSFSGDVMFYKNVCVVPLASPNSHNYAIGVPVLFRMAGDYFYMADGNTSGNCMTRQAVSLRPAMEEEIVTCIKALPLGIVEGIK